MKKTLTYSDGERDGEEPPPPTFPEEALTDGDVLSSAPLIGDEAERLAGHVPLGSERSCVLGVNVELMRKTAKLSKVRFCELVGISRPMLDKIERGESNPRLDLLERLAHVLGVRVSDLITPPFGDVDTCFYQRSRQKKPPGDH